MFRILLFLLLIANTLAAQTIKNIKLKAPAGKISLRNFRISNVVDDREDTTHIGTMRAGITNKTALVNLQDGARIAVTEFINNYTHQPSGKEDIELHLLTVNVSEKSKGTKEQVDLETKYGFFYKGKKVIDYGSAAYVQTGMDASPYIGKLVSQSIEQVLKEFDKWWPDNKQLYDESKKNEIKVQVTLKTKSTDPDHLVYNQAVPLTLSDFRGPVDELSKALAATYSGFALQYEVKGNNMGSTANIEIMPYFDYSKSWVKNEGRTAYVLQHEQLHFDITAIKAFELITAIRAAQFTAEGIKEEIAALQRQYSKALEQMQAQYDGETSHGILKDKQSLWFARIKNELQEKAAAAGL